MTAADNQFIPFGVIILGAGASARMGRPKLLLPWNGSTVIGQLIGQWRQLGVGQIVVVQRAENRALTAELDRLEVRPGDRIVNPQPERGMFSSILCAARWDGWRPEITNRAIVLGDQPHLAAATLQALLEFTALNREAICQPAFGGSARHPVILPAAAWESLKQSPADTLKSFLNLAPCRSVQCPVPDAGLALDLDTPEDYKRLLAQTNIVA